MSNRKQKKEKPLSHKEIEIWDFNMYNKGITSDDLDGERAIAWGTYMGMLLGDFVTFIDNYCQARGRKYFMALNNWGQPTAFFDVESIEELYEQWCKEREQLKKLSEHETREFLPPKKEN